MMFPVLIHGEVTEARSNGPVPIVEVTLRRLNLGRLNLRRPNSKRSL